MQRRLKNSFDKYGINSHIFDVIELCEIVNLNERERYWQEFYDVISSKGLNCKLTKTDDKSGVLCKDTRDKISNSLKGRKRIKEQKDKMSKSQSGKKQSKETV